MGTSQSRSPYQRARDIPILSLAARGDSRLPSIHGCLRVPAAKPVHDTARDSGDETEGANRSEPERASGPAVRLRRGVAREICKAARDTAEDVTAIAAWRR